MDRLGKISLSIVCGGTVVAAVLLVASPNPDAPAPATIVETASPDFVTPAPPAAKSFTDGDYIIGEDIPLGTYVSAGAKPDVFELCMVSSSSSVDGHWPILKTANADDRIIVQVTARNRGDVLSITGCTPFEKR